MAWQNKGKKMSLGQFVRPKQERQILIKFIGEPKEVEGKNFQGQKVDELQFPILFWDERSTSQRYKEGEAVQIILSNEGESKVLPIQGGPLLRELLAEDETEPIMDRYFVIQHTGQGKDTAYKIREVRVPKQAPIVESKDSDQDDERKEDDQGPTAEEQKTQNDTRHEKFIKEVKKRTKAKETRSRKAEPSEKQPEQESCGSEAEAHVTSQAA